MKKINLSIAAVLLMSSASAFAANSDRSGVTCANLPTYAQLRTALAASVNASAGGTQATSTQGFGLPMWATLVDSSGRVCAVAKIGGTDPWLGSRVISAQKANTANAFSTNQIALSTANLFSAVQPGGSLYGLQHSNPVNTLVAYRGAATKFGAADDPMVGLRIGGVNVFGGGLALYNSAKQAVGAIGVSGDSSCADHNIAWNLRAALALAAPTLVSNLVPGGVSPGPTAAGSDNIQYGAVGGWNHANCSGTNTVPALGALTN
ncbi:MAG: heme-binding protein [Methylotenera sp.]|nr:heme-binding protein [Methylotenera sp.]NOT64517.1 heme-binding protein [Methylotenera sp.]